jgi:hypothetical protein
MWPSNRNPVFSTFYFFESAEEILGLSAFAGFPAVGRLNKKASRPASVGGVERKCGGARGIEFSIAKAAGDNATICTFCSSQA